MQMTVPSLRSTNMWSNQTRTPAGAPEPPAPAPASELADALKQALTPTQRAAPEADGRWIERRGMSPLTTRDIR